MSEHNKTESLGVGADHKYTFCDEPHPDGVLRCHRRAGHTEAADPAERAHEASWVSGDPCFWGEGAAEAKEAQAAKEELWRVRRALETADFDWRLKAQPGQRPPDTAWSLWMVLGGRGSGLTRTGAEQVRTWSKDPEARIAIVGRAPRDALDGMARMVWTVAPPTVKPVLSKSEIRFPSGARGFVLGADQVTAGPSYTHAWVDDLTLFEDAEKVWRDLRLCVRGPLVVTAHPNVEAPGDALLRDLVLNQASVVTRVGPGSPFDPTGKINPNAKPVTYPKVLSALKDAVAQEVAKDISERRKPVGVFVGHTEGGALVATTEGLLRNAREDASEEDDFDRIQAEWLKAKR